MIVYTINNSSDGDSKGNDGGIAIGDVEDVDVGWRNH